MTYLRDLPGSKEEHEFVEIHTDDEKTIACRICMATWKRKPNRGRCAGVRIYDEWADVPKGLVSKTAMYRDHKRKLIGDPLPFAVKRTETNNFVPLYPIVAGRPVITRKTRK